MKQDKKIYSFKGGIYRFGSFICNWEGETCAVTEGKARNNLEYRARKTLGLAPDTPLHLIGKLTEIKTN